MTSVNTLLHFHQGDATFEITWPKSQLAMNLTSGKWEAAIQSLCVTTFLFDCRVSTQLTLWRDHMAALAGRYVKSHLIDQETGC